MNNQIILERIDAECAKRGIVRATALIESGAGRSFGSNLQSGSKPSIEKIQLLADYFDVSIDYLLGRDPKDVPAFSPKQRKVLELYESLSPEQQENFERLLDSVLGLKKQ